MIEGLKCIIRRERSYYGIRENKMYLRDEIRNYKVTTFYEKVLRNNGTYNRITDYCKRSGGNTRRKC